MSDIGEAIGTAVEGGLFARVVGGGKGDGRKGDPPLEKGHFAENACLNCGTELTGPHCHQCGQQAHLHRTLGAFAHDLLHGALHFDGKTWRTLPKLVFKPGELTRRYIEGERARFVSPMALFLFSIFLMFAIFQFAGISTPTELNTSSSERLRELAINEVAKLETRQAELNEKLEDEELNAEVRAATQTELAQVEQQLEGIRQAQEDVPFLNGVLGDEPAAKEETVGGVPVVTDAEGNTSIPLSVDGDTKMNIGTSEIGWIEEALGKWRKNPVLMLYKLQNNFYKFSWLLIPLSIPFVWLLFFWKRRFKAYDHAIFVTYSLSFMTLLILTMVMVGLAGAHPILIVLPSILIPPIHIYKQLRGTYGLSRFSAIWRLGALTVFILVILTLFLQALLVLGAF